MAKLSAKQIQALRDYAEGYEQPDLDDFYGAAGALAFRNRERVIDALKRRGLVDAGGITQAGRDILAGRQVDTDGMSEAQFAAFVA